MRKNLKFNSYKRRLLTLIQHPIFWALTIAGNSLTFLGGFVFQILESTQEKPLAYIDCLVWSTGIVTTIGSSDLMPQTFYGKVFSVALMLAGTFFIWAYMAFLVSGLLTPELFALEKEVSELEKEVHSLASSGKKNES